MRAPALQQLGRTLVGLEEEEQQLHHPQPALQRRHRHLAHAVQHPMMAQYALCVPPSCAAAQAHLPLDQDS
jgi:hypothetical protein